MRTRRKIDTHSCYFRVRKVIKSVDPGVLVIAVEPVESQVLEGRRGRSHKIQGIGAGFVPSIYDSSVVDLVFDAAYTDAVDTPRRLAKEEGTLVGMSSGAVAFAAL